MIFFYYSITGSVAWARNKVLSRIESESTPWYRTNIGEPLGQIYGYKAIGLYQTQEQLDNRPFVGNGVQRLGDIMYEDINGDGKITQDGDKVKISAQHFTRVKLLSVYGLQLERVPI
ncbi:hypothetical protein NXY48_16945 [Bacteroides ovatus]|nr:hypothetical protein [Bacteroides ovatus]